MTELALIRKAQRGSSEALNSLLTLHYAPVYKVLLKMTHGDREKAEDLAQDSFILALRHLKKFRGDSKFSTWLHQIAVNAYLMSLRKGRLETADLSEVNESFLASKRPNPEQELLSSEITQLVEDLPKGYSFVFKLRVFYGFKHQEIAKKLGCMVGNSKSQFYKAKEKLRQQL